jgi:predicted transcriptional regulator of viral defense system
LQRLQQTPGQVIRVAELEALGLTPLAVASALNRLTKTDQVQRVAKGRYRVVPMSRFGPVPASEQQLLTAVLQRDATGRLEYPTGAVAFNRLGLTTQVPRVIEIATPWPKPPRQIGTLRLRYVRNMGAADGQEVELRQLLDALRRIKRVPATTPTKVVGLLCARIRALSAAEKAQLVQLALTYNPGTRALLGALLEQLGEKQLSHRLHETLNPLTSYRLGLSATALPNLDHWRIR